MLRFTQLKTAETLGDFKIYLFLCVFMKCQVRNTPISRFCEIGFKIPDFLEIRTHISPQMLQKSHHPKSHPPKRGPQSRALCGAVCALSIAIVLY